MAVSNGKQLSLVMLPGHKMSDRCKSYKYIREQIICAALTPCFGSAAYLPGQLPAPGRWDPNACKLLSLVSADLLLTGVWLRAGTCGGFLTCPVHR